MLLANGYKILAVLDGIKLTSNESAGQDCPHLHNTLIDQAEFNAYLDWQRLHVHMTDDIEKAWLT